MALASDFRMEESSHAEANQYAANNRQMSYFLAQEIQSPESV